MICMGEASLRYTLTQYLAHYHAERNHQGLNNQLIVPDPAVSKQTGQVVHRERLGGLLSYYYWEGLDQGIGHLGSLNPQKHERRTHHKG